MRLSSKPLVGFDSEISITFKIPITARKSVEPVIDTINTFLPEIEYDLAFTKARKKRSNNANAYMWQLADKIAALVNCTKEEVYRKGIKEVGVFSDVAVQPAACNSLVKSWCDNGIGWFAEMFDSNLKDLNGDKLMKVRLYKGSSKYDTKEMARLIDWIVEEANCLGLETMTEKELMEMKQSWIE